MASDDARDRLVRGLDATQRVLDQTLSVARELATAQAELRAIGNEVTTLARILRDGNGDSIMSQVTLLRADLDHVTERVEAEEQRAGRWQDRLWQLLGPLAVGLFLGFFLWRMEGCERLLQEGRPRPSASGARGGPGAAQTE